MRLMLRTAATGALSVLVCVQARTAALTAAEVAQAVQKKYDAVRDFSCEFSHVYRGGALKKQITEHGTLLIKKPGKMRWNDAAPDNNVFVSDGVKIYSYIPADKQVIVSDVPSGDAASTPLLFLAGKGNLTRDFTVSLIDADPAMPPGTLALKLVPKTAQPDYDWLVVEVEPGTFRLRGLVTLDAQGSTSTFSFMNLKENVGLADKEFEFRPPRGVEVVTDSPRR
jgi:outer membrane lipoprotein carrier protein